MKPADQEISLSSPAARPEHSGRAAASWLLRLLKLLNRLLDVILLGGAGILILLGAYALADNARIYAEADRKVFQVYRPTSGKAAFESLRKKNPEVQGWICIPGTDIDYPFVQGGDNRKYTNLSPDGKFSLSGSLFLDSRNHPDCSDFNTFLYGHHMDHDEMFGGLDHYRDSSYFDRHRKGTLYLNDHAYGLEFFGLVNADAYDTRVYTPAIPAAQKEQYLQALAERAERWQQEGADASDHLLLLSTCADGRTNARLLLVGRILPDAEVPLADPPAVTRSLSAHQQFPWPAVILLCFLMILLISLLAKSRRNRQRKGMRKNLNL